MPDPQQRFNIAVDFVFTQEGYYSNDPIDPGGKTKWGISSEAHPDLDIESLTQEQAREIYRKEYWDGAKCDTYPWPLSLCVFDAAVQHGPARARSWIPFCNGDWAEYNLVRLGFYVQICNVHPDRRHTFLYGWMARLSRLSQVCRKFPEEGNS